MQGKTESQKWKMDLLLCSVKQFTWNSTICTIKCMVCTSSATTLSVLFPYELSKHLKSLDPQKILLVRTPKTVTAVAIQVIRAVTFIV